MTTCSDRIVADYRVMLGKPVIRGTRLTVESLLRKLAQGATSADLLVMYPQLTAADVQAALEYASDAIGKEEFLPPRAA